jgi:hypothetical protein
MRSLYPIHSIIVHAVLYTWADEQSKGRNSHDMRKRNLGCTVRIITEVIILFRA